MKTRIFAGLVVGWLALSCGLGMAFQKPTFGGEWTMDRERSFGLPGKQQQAMKIVQTGDQIDLETRLINPEGEDTVKDSYVVDGKERDFTPKGPKGPVPGSKGKRTANWLPNGKGIAVDEETTTETPKGPVMQKLTRRWTISSAGELVIDMYIDTATVSYETKRIFRKS
jgi:hypothetical protein